MPRSNYVVESDDESELVCLATSSSSSSPRAKKRARKAYLDFDQIQPGCYINVHGDNDEKYPATVIKIFDVEKRLVRVIYDDGECNTVDFSNTKCELISKSSPNDDIVLFDPVFNETYHIHGSQELYERGAEIKMYVYSGDLRVADRPASTLLSSAASSSSSANPTAISMPSSSSLAVASSPLCLPEELPIMQANLDAETAHIAEKQRKLDAEKAELQAKRQIMETSKSIEAKRQRIIQGFTELERCWQREMDIEGTLPVIDKTSSISRTETEATFAKLELELPSGIDIPALHAKTPALFTPSFMRTREAYIQATARFKSDPDRPRF